MSRGLWWPVLVEAFNLMAGVPDYRRYLAHMAACHPERAVMDYRSFFRAAERRRYGADGGRHRCC